jgi:hypothetical protein
VVDGVDIFPDPTPASSFDAAKRILAQMLGGDLPDDEKLKLLLGFAIEDIETVLDAG